MGSCCAFCTADTAQVESFTSCPGWPWGPLQYDSDSKSTAVPEALSGNSDLDVTSECEKTPSEVFSNAGSNLEEFEDEHTRRSRRMPVDLDDNGGAARAKRASQLACSGLPARMEVLQTKSDYYLHNGVSAQTAATPEGKSVLPWEVNNHIMVVDHRHGVTSSMMRVKVLGSMTKVMNASDLRRVGGVVNLQQPRMSSSRTTRGSNGGGNDAPSSALAPGEAVFRVPRASSCPSPAQGAAHSSSFAEFPTPSSRRMTWDDVLEPPARSLRPRSMTCFRFF